MIRLAKASVFLGLLGVTIYYGLNMAVWVMYWVVNLL